MIWKLGAKQRRNPLSIRHKGLAERVTRPASLRADMACAAPIDRRISKRISSECLQELGHRKRRDTPNKENNYRPNSTHDSIRPPKSERAIVKTTTNSDRIVLHKKRNCTRKTSF